MDKYHSQKRMKLKHVTLGIECPCQQESQSLSTRDGWLQSRLYEALEAPRASLVFEAKSLADVTSRPEVMQEHGNAFVQHTLLLQAMLQVQGLRTRPQNKETTKEEYGERGKEMEIVRRKWVRDTTQRRQYPIPSLRPQDLIYL